jgi:hypothetical protein
MHVLLVEPAYHTRFPPLGLLDLASYRRPLGDSVELVRGMCQAEPSPETKWRAHVLELSKELDGSNMR